MKNFNRDYNKFPFEVIVVDDKPEKNIKSTIFWLLLILGIILGICSYNNSPEKEDIDVNLSPYPVYNGEIIVYPDYECVCPLEIKAQSGMNCYVRLCYLREPRNSYVCRTLSSLYSDSYESDIAFYVEAGKTVKVHVPIGVYKFYYATGQTFYGPKELFGKYTSCYTSSEELYFYSDGYTYSGGSITLQKVPNGNFSTNSVNKNSFPSD